MILNNPFRKAALRRSAQPEPLDSLPRVTAPREWMLVTALCISMLAAVAWFATASFERTLSGSGVLVYGGERRVVNATWPGVVSEVMVAAGDRVEAGQTIARMRSPDLEWRLRVVRARVAFLEDLAAEPGNGSGEWAIAALAEARAEMVELEAITSETMLVSSPVAGEITVADLVPLGQVNVGDMLAEIRLGGPQPLEAIMLVPSDEEHRIAAGMTARVALEDRSGSEVLAAKVHSFVPRSAAFSRFDLEGEDPAAGKMVRLSLDGAGDLRLRDGWPCRIQIVLERNSALGLLLPAARAAE